MLRRIFSYMKEYKKYAWLALICIGVEVVLEIMVPKLMADLIDIGVTNSDVPYIINKGIQMAVCAVAALILGVGSARFSALALVCTFLWGSASPCIKLGYALFKIPSSETWTQVLFAGTRFVFAGVLTILIGSILNRKMLLPTKSSVPNIVKLAMFQTILQYIFFYIGLAHNSGVKASIINGSNTFFVILVSTIIFRQEKLNLKKIIG